MEGMNITVIKLFSKMIPHELVQFVFDGILWKEIDLFVVVNSTTVANNESKSLVKVRRTSAMSQFVR